jgi:outer membrane protein OmpA-like peptidoglycan-associated protein
MLRVSFVLFFMASALLTQGQGTKVLIDQGDKAFGHGAFEEAVAKYQEAAKLAPEDPNIQLKIGVALLSTHRKHEALPYLDNAYMAKHDISQEINYYLGYAHQVRGEYQKAIEHLRLFKRRHKRFSAIADQKIEECQLAEKLMQKPSALSVELLPPPINTRFSDFSPLLDSAETTLVFTSARDTSKRDLRENNRLFESILLSEKIGGLWTTPQPLSKEINHDGHDAATHLSPDGKTMVLYYGHTRDLFVSKYSSEDYKADHLNGLWSKPEPMPAPINSIAWESSGSFSPDGQYFFFSSDRNEGYGELDIYMCKREPDGSWGKPLNLGPNVNTPANEDAPFMHQDGTLYFGSEGHPGLGSYDIFKTKFKEGKWQKPENMGYPVNSPEYENYFFMTADKLRGYFSSIRKDGLGSTDIYMATFPKELVVDSVSLAIRMRADSLAKADSIATIARNLNAASADSLEANAFVDPSIKAEFHVATEFKGKVLDEDDGTPLYAEIVLVDNKTNKILTRAYSSRKSGVFLIVIPHGGNYGVSASCDGYLFTSMNFDVPAFAESQTIETAIFMSKAEVGSKSTLKNIFFDSGKSDLRSESVSELTRLVNLLTKNPRLRVQINGHTDSFGDNATNKVLSLKRAQSVVDYLIKNGIETSRVKAVGYGEERPLVSNDDEEGGREFNRRTEIEVVEVTQP